MTDVLQISANPLPVVRACDLMEFLNTYCAAEPVERILVGEPRRMDGQPSESLRYITPFLNRLRRELPGIPVEMVDERFTSVMAHRDMLTAGFKKSDRERRGLLHEILVILQNNSFLRFRKKIGIKTWNG